ncbi:MAG TPA: outer membrane lipoprotein chaperone LolA [Bacteroidota bacterium]|nr:outer membrane lipoprotein chaperone LolA [Bacteroidota bacterium]
MTYVGRLVILLLCGLSAVVGRQKEMTAKEITDRLQKKYDAMQDATVKFRQQVKFGFSKLEQNFEGTLTMKRPNKYRVEFEHQTLVTDGAVVWSYSPVNKQVLVDRYRENQNSLSPEKFLLNLPAQYYTTLLGKEKVENVETYALKLVPKDDQSFVKSVKMWVEDGTWIVRKVQIVDVNDTETVYTIKELKLNTRVSDALFSFTPPAGTEVVDLR